MYQFHLPSSFMDAGSTTPRISVASIATATARPTPNSCRSISESVAKIENTRDHHGRRGGHDAGRAADALLDGGVVAEARSQPSLMRLRMNTW